MWDYKLRLVTIRVSDQWPGLISGSWWWGLSNVYNCHWISLTLSLSLPLSLSVSLYLYLSVSISLYLYLSLSLYHSLSLSVKWLPPPRYIFFGSSWGAYDGYFLIFLLILFFREVVQICRRLWHFLTHICNKKQVLHCECKLQLFIVPKIILRIYIEFFNLEALNLIVYC